HRLHCEPLLQARPPYYSPAPGRSRRRCRPHRLHRERFMKHFVIATAGHVDHGKSSLVKALTGTDPDRLPEEKARKITIDLGFAHLELPSAAHRASATRSEEHTSELQSLRHLVCRLLLEKKNKKLLKQ